MLKFILAYLAIGLLTSVIYIIFAIVCITSRTVKNHFAKDENKEDLDKLSPFNKTLTIILCTVACIFICIFETFKYLYYFLFVNVLIWPAIVFVMFNKDFLNNYLKEEGV